MEKQTHVLETMTRIYTVITRPIMRYTAETRSDTAKTQKMLKTIEMRTKENHEEHIEKSNKK